MEVPTGLVVAAGAYIAVSGLLLAGLALLASPALVISRRRRAYFEDWNGALSAPWLFWHIAGWLFRAQELLGNYVVPAPQRVCDLAFSHFRSQVRGAAVSRALSLFAAVARAAAALPADHSQLTAR